MFYLYSYKYFTNNKTDNEFKKFEKNINKKLINKLKPYIKDLSNNLNNQKAFAEKAYIMLDALGFDLSVNSNEEVNNQNNNDNESSEDENNKNGQTIKDKEGQDDETSEDSKAKESSMNEGEKNGDEQGDDFEGSYKDNNIVSKNSSYKVFTKEFDEIIEANKLCDIQELEKLRISLDKQVFFISNINC